MTRITTHNNKVRNSDEQGKRIIKVLIIMIIPKAIKI